MRFGTTANTVETSGLAETTNFSIKVTGKAFKILLDGLYADKPAAVIRELSTNAYDAHLAIGRGDVPFTVQIPTLFDPTFRVRDYGVSMTHEQTMRLMSTIFDSTKDTSNTQVGAFGLGSKSPFSLVDTFSLNVILNGEKRMYSAFFNPDGVPSMALLGREPTTEPNGVEFSMTIDQKDVPAFKTRALRILRWFPTHPNVFEGTTPLALPVNEVVAEGKGWMLLNVDKTVMPGASARQGCVVYPLNAGAIGTLSEQHRALMDAPLVIDFPIGSLDVAASREALSYDPQTCANIVARLNLVTKECMEHFGKAIADAPTLWEAGKKRSAALNSNLPRGILTAVGQLKWQNKAIPAHFSVNEIRNTLNKTARAKDPTAEVLMSVCAWDRYRIARVNGGLQCDYTAESYARRSHYSYGDDTLKIFFSVTDARPTHEGRRIREACQSNEHALLFILPDEATQAEILEEMGTPPSANVIWTKDLPVPVLPKRNAPAPKRGVTKKEEVKARRFVPGNNYELAAEVLVPLEDKAYYVIYRDGKLRSLGPNNDDGHEVATFINGLKSAGTLGYLPTEPMYIISSVYEKRLNAFIEDGGKWGKLDEYVRTAAADLDNRLFQESEATNLWRHTQTCNWALLLKSGYFAGMLKGLTTGPLYTLSKVIESLDIKKPANAATQTGYWSGSVAVSAPDQSVGNNLWPMGAFQIDTSLVNSSAHTLLQASKKLKSLTSASEECNRAYPLLRGYDSSQISKNASAAQEYIEAINLLEETRRAKRIAALSAAPANTQALLSQAA
jgi:hypothetical protein